MKEINLKSRDEIIENDPLKKFFVWWDDISEADVKDFKVTLDQAKNEHEIQQYLQEHPLLLIQHCSGGHGRWVIPKQRLGAEYQTDFLIAERSSLGFQWRAVELESPKASMFNKRGDPSQSLNHAIRQIEDWRAWLEKNQNYAARSKLEQGLGLTNIVSRVPGLILIGRRSQIDPKTNERRRQRMQSSEINIHSYNFLLENAKGRLKALKRLKVH